MAPTESPVSHRVLLVDEGDAVCAMMSCTLERKGLNVVTRGGQRDRRLEADK